MIIYIELLGVDKADFYYYILQKLSILTNYKPITKINELPSSETQIH